MVGVEQACDKVELFLGLIGVKMTHVGLRLAAADRLRGPSPCDPCRFAERCKRAYTPVKPSARLFTVRAR